MKTIKFYTLGCKVNQYDTQSIREQFLKNGYQEIDNGKTADTYFINTCTVTAIADRKAKNIIRHCLRENPKARIMVTGCLVEKDALSLSDIKGIDFLISKRFFREGISNFCGHTRAFLKIQDGCNNSCAYCKVPLVRGVSRSRPLLEIIKEAKKLVQNGFQEIVLSGICLGAFGKDLKEAISLVDAIEGLENIEGLLRIRLSSLEAVDVSDRLIQQMAESQKLCWHLHIPIQSGDDAILKKMGRRYKRKDYSALIYKIKKYLPHVAITTDVLVGFPGEDEKNFQNTLNLIQEILPLKVHIFPYSPRPGTPAFNFKDKVSPVIIKQRISKLKEIARECAFIYRKQFLKKKMEVLLETRSLKNPCLWFGFTRNYIKVSLESNQNLKNQIMTLKLKKVVSDSVRAEFC